MSHRDFDLNHGIKRAAGLPIVVMQVADVVLRPNPEYPSLQQFNCSALRASISVEACKANYINEEGPMACRGCAVGRHHAGVDNERGKIAILNDKHANRHARAQAAKGLSCVRCMRDGSEEGSRFISWLRLINHGTTCISCYNRARESKTGGLNSKGAAIRKWANCLFPTSLVIKTPKGPETIDIGVTTGPSEARRHAERRGFELVEIIFDGVVATAGTPDYAPLTAKQVSTDVHTIRAGYPGVTHEKPMVLWEGKSMSTLARETGMSAERLRARMNSHGTPFPDQLVKIGRPPRSVHVPSITIPGDVASVARPDAVLASDPSVYAESGNSGSGESGSARLPTMTPEQAPAYEQSFAKNRAQRNTEVRVPRGRAIDITGQRFGLLTAIEHEGTDSSGKAVWLFHCDCGTGKSIRANNAMAGMTKSCGCLYRKRLANGMRAGAEKPHKDVAVPLTHFQATCTPEQHPHALAGGLTWHGRALAEIAAERGEDLAVMESRMVATGMPFAPARKSVRPPPSITRVEAPSPVADTSAATEVEQPIVEPHAQPQTAPPVGTYQLHLVDAKLREKRPERTRKLTKAEKKAEKRAAKAERQAAATPRPNFRPKAISVGTKSVAMLAAMGLGKVRII